MTPGQVWEVVGGADKGGILVREGQSTDSSACGSRLSTGAAIRELALEGDRLCYELLAGTGPPTGWVSLRVNEKDLLAKAALWQVVGGGSAGGIVAREGPDPTSAQCPERLGTAAIVKQVQRDGVRLQYELLVGCGPPQGWVKIELDSGKVLLTQSDGSSIRSVAPKPDASDDIPPWAPYRELVPLDVRMSNEEKGFSYEGLPAWVPKAAAVARLRREGQAYFPADEWWIPRLDRPKPMAPFVRIPPKQLKEVSKKDLPGCMFGLSIPIGAEEMVSPKFGPRWLTEAFHAAGTLPEDNSVVKIVDCKDLPIKGFDTAGGAALKMFLTVEYDKPDSELHTELFVKYPWDPEKFASQRSNAGADDGPEVRVNLYLAHAFPFRSPKCYFGDISRETANYIIITEKIPYGERIMAEDGKSAKPKDDAPYKILPVCGKYQDFLLPDPETYYCALFRAIGQLAAWDKLGRFDFILGPMDRYTAQQYLPSLAGREPKTMKQAEKMREAVGRQMDKGIDFLIKIAPNLAPPQLRNEARLRKVKEEIMYMAPWLSDMSGTYQNNNSDYLAASHANLQADNAYFWKDEYGDIACGVIDWGGFGRAPLPVKFLGCLSGADAPVLLAHEEGIIRSFVDEYYRCGGPKLSLEEVVRRFELAYITNVYDCNSWLDKQVYKETKEEEFATMTGIHDERFMNSFLTRCGALTVICTWQFYIANGRFKALFDEWSAGAGKPYLQRYE